jgi:hypothetical protein
MAHEPHQAAGPSPLKRGVPPRRPDDDDKGVPGIWLPIGISIVLFAVVGYLFFGPELAGDRGMSNSTTISKPAPQTN